MYRSGYRWKNRIAGIVVFCLAIGIHLPAPALLAAEALLADNFDGIVLDPETWHIPTWVSPDDGTFVGQTQFRCVPAPLPDVSGGSVMIQLETYNPTGSSFYGTDLISNPSFSASGGLRVTLRAKMDTATPGIVAGIFLYVLKAQPEAPTLHDEIDFELLTNRPGQVLTNIYSNEPLGNNHPLFVSYASGSITDWHTYEIVWTPERVSWFIDGRLVRTDTDHVPTGPMHLHLNLWVPDSDFEEAYSPDFKHTDIESENQVFSMRVDSVAVESPASASGGSGLAPILPVLILD